MSFESGADFVVSVACWPCCDLGVSAEMCVLCVVLAPLSLVRVCSAVMCVNWLRCVL